jgi:uncharacterized protein (DUF1501 family)
MTSPPALSDLDVTRRGFLRAGSAGVVGLSLREQTALARGTSRLARRRAIFILMAGGPSQLETFDPKPEAPPHIRGPMRAIATKVPGVWLSESLPKLAERADRFALVRSLTHDYAPIHETGQQLLQCGRLIEAGVRFPHFGAIVAKAAPKRRSKVPANVVLPRVLHDTGTHAHRGQSAGGWGIEWDPIELASGPKNETDAVRRTYGDTPFGRLLLQARQQIERGTNVVTVNLFDSLHGRVTWDAHGDAECAPGTVYDYRDTLCPQFDQALSALLDDLRQRGLFDDTLVVATGEFGRTPRMNDHGGRDHWTGCWSALIAGGGVTGGAVIGASDHTAAAPIDRPVSPPEITATLLGWFGIDGREHEVAIGKKAESLIPADPLRELWG